MAFLGIRVPNETARLLGGLEVPGKREANSSLHVTMFFFGDEVSIEALAEIMKATYGVTSQAKPFTVRTSQLTSFPAGDDGQPIICRIESDALHDLREKIREVYEANKVEFSNKYPDYKPHVTLAYNDGAEPFQEARIPTVEWGAHELVLWGGDSGDDKLVVTFPFALGDLDKLAAARVARRYVGAP
jgi:2'-5' RNA ligase